MTKRLLKHDEDTGITTWFEHDSATRKNIITTTQDCTLILDTNTKIQNESNGWSKSKFMRHAASIPIMVLFKWMQEGFDPFDPNNKKALFKRLDDTENRKLRTSLWHLS
jgi:hypothetical protein